MGEVDEFVGARIRARRTALSMSQDDLARLVGARRQQLQKYETGSRRVSASRLWQIADILDVPVTFFFETLFVGRACDQDSSTRTAYPAHADALEFATDVKALPDGSKAALVNFLRTAEEEKTPSQEG